MSANRHIAHKYNKTAESESMLETTMLEIATLTTWAAFITYLSWYVTSAKYNAPLTVDEARMLWKIHRQDGHCSAKRWREIRSHDKIVGFECDCGYAHLQRRPVVAGTLAYDHLGMQVSAYDKPQTTYG